MSETRGEAVIRLRHEMIRMSGTEDRLDYLEGQLGPEVAATAAEIVRLSRLSDYESPIDGVRWSSFSHAAIGTRIVDAILADVFQGRKPHLRDQMLHVAAKADRGLVMEPWWEEKTRVARAALTAATEEDV